MENNKIIRLNASTKILYSLFNFFAPISFITIGVNALNAYNIIGTLFSILSIAIGLFCLISNLIKYNRFLYINNKTITICKGKINNPKVIQIIKTENLASEKMSNNFTIKYENKKIQLLHTSFSMLGTICYVGPLVFIPVLKSLNTTFNNLVELYEVFPALFEKAPKKTTKFYDIIIDIIAWGFVLFVSAIGCLGILLTPFYPFLNSI